MPTSETKSCSRYAAIVAQVARERGLAFVDLFTPTRCAVLPKSRACSTRSTVAISTKRGDREVAVHARSRAVRRNDRGEHGFRAFQKLRAAVNDKSWVHLQDYRMLNGWYVYGGRRTWDTETFPREYNKIRAMAAVRDRYVWDLAQGKSPGAARRQRDRRTDRSADAVRQPAAALLRAGRAEISVAGRVHPRR